VIDDDSSVSEAEQGNDDRTQQQVSHNKGEEHVEVQQVVGEIRNEAS